MIVLNKFDKNSFDINVSEENNKTISIFIGNNNNGDGQEYSEVEANTIIFFKIGHTTCSIFSFSYGIIFGTNVETNNLLIKEIDGILKEYSQIKGGHIVREIKRIDLPWISSETKNNQFIYSSKIGGMEIENKIDPTNTTNLYTVIITIIAEQPSEKQNNKLNDMEKAVDRIYRLININDDNKELVL